MGPVRDLLRRVLTINIDPRVATPATMVYQEDPVKKVREQREKYISAVFAIILAWRKAGSPKSNIQNIVTYSGSWSDYCRHPLMWLGLPDPATSLLEQVTHDPDAEILTTLLTEWYMEFNSKPTTVRKLVEIAQEDSPDLLDALHEFPIVERGNINRSKLGWILKKNANRIVGNFELQKTTADGRTAWQVVQVADTGLSSLTEEQKRRLADRAGIQERLGLDKYDM